MNFTDKKFPFIKMLSDGNIGGFSSKLPQSNIKPEILSAILTKIYVDGIEYQVYSRPFVEKAWQLGKDLILFFNKLQYCEGCVLLPWGAGIYYFIDPKAVWSVRALVLCDKTVAGFCEAQIKPAKAMTTEGFDAIEVHDKRLIIDWHKEIWTIVVVNLLKQFAKTEIKYIGGSLGPKKSEINTIKYLSDLPESIMHFDCSWFIECVSDKEYGVSAHIRLQPCGPGRSLLKFVFVRAYLKHGYHRRARKDLLQISNN